MAEISIEQLQKENQKLIRAVAPFPDRKSG